MIEIDNLTKRFKRGMCAVNAIDSLNLNIKNGEFLAIMGPSGCGKTTFLNLMGMIEEPCEGYIKYNGHKYSSFSPKERLEFRKQKIGMVFQYSNLINELNVFENIELPLLYKKGLTKYERFKKVQDIMDLTNISHRKDNFPEQLSGGQQQRVAIARAIISNAEIILADEPTGNLDSKNRKQVMSILKDLNKTGKTIIMVTHSQSDAFYADRIINLFDGKIVNDTNLLES
ncbi:MAG: ABC transporter ATP-binding protein [Candidatus Delongbacteria bacterium]|nr:ABC transporter ATP-binding protein [Candidatus Delongbacteria bacterium]MBN2836890.1 ABC transporter ATP-binding protein [Candidatus Delongbacteria bacterium]